MDDKDTFYTVEYKGQYIHGCWNITRNFEEIKFNKKLYKSLHAAKIAVTKYLNEAN